MEKKELILLLLFIIMLPGCSKKIKPIFIDDIDECLVDTELPDPHDKICCQLVNDTISSQYEEESIEYTEEEWYDVDAREANIKQA